MVKNVKVGNIMEQEKTVYKNNGFIITEHPRKREYDDPLINKKDRIYRIKIIGTNQPTIEDCAELVYYLLKNKIYYKKFVEYKDIILNSIKRAENDREDDNNGKLEDWIKDDN